MSTQDKVQAMKSMKKLVIEEPYKQVVDEVELRAAILEVPSDLYVKMMLSSIGHIKPQVEIYVQECLNFSGPIEMKIIEQDKTLQDYCIFKIEFEKDQTMFTMYNLGFISKYFVELARVYEFPFYFDFVSAILVEKDMEIKEVYMNYMIMYAQAVEAGAKENLDLIKILDKAACARYPKWQMTLLRKRLLA